jgi:hypothetical protein
MELRRASARIAKLEDRASELRLDAAGGVTGWPPDAEERRATARRQLAIAAEIKHQEARVRELLVGARPRS